MGQPPPPPHRLPAVRTGQACPGLCGDTNPHPWVSEVSGRTGRKELKGLPTQEELGQASLDGGGGGVRGGRTPQHKELCFWVPARGSCSHCGD